MMASVNDQLMTADQLADRWQVACKSKKAEAIYRMVRSGLIPPGAVVRLGRGNRNIRFKLAGIEAFEDEGGAKEME